MLVHIDQKWIGEPKMLKKLLQDMVLNNSHMMLLYSTIG